MSADHFYKAGNVEEARRALMKWYEHVRVACQSGDSDLFKDFLIHRLETTGLSKREATRFERIFVKY